LAHRDLSLGKALVNSWGFFRRNMRDLWGAVIAMFLLNITIVIFQEMSQSIGGMISFLATPFSTMIIIIWTITLINEEQKLALLDSEIGTARTWEEEVLLNSTSETNESYNSEHDNSAYDDSAFDDSLYHSNMEEHTFAPDYKPRAEDSPPGYYHSSPRYSEKENMESSTELNFCPTCGTKIRLNVVYCAKCGVKLR